MTNEEAHNYLENLQREFTLNRQAYAEDLIEANGKAIEALEKQIPKKPDFEGDAYDQYGDIVYDTWICPYCDERFETGYEELDFCPWCGQAIDWSEDDDTERNT